MVNFTAVKCILTTWAVVAAASAAPLAGSPGPAQATSDCFDIVYDHMIGCMGFLMNGGIETTPNDACCSGLKAVIKVNGDCICYALNMSPSLGLDINMTRAEALPKDCRVSGHSISNCHVSASPGESPVSASPNGSPSNSPAANAPHLHHPTLAPATQPPAAAAPAIREGPATAPAAAIPATRKAPAAAPYGMASSPDSQVAAPSPAPSGAYAISVSLSALLAIVGSFLLFSA